MNWEMDGVSIEPEELFEVLKFHAFPLGVIIFGADSALKADVYRIFRRHLGRPLSFDRKGINSHTGQIRSAFHQGQPVLVCLHGNMSMSADRQSMIRRLEHLGAHTLVGVYANASRRDPINFQAIDLEADFDHRAYYRQLQALADRPPTPEEPFHCFITVESSDHDYPTPLRVLKED